MPPSSPLSYCACGEVRFGIVDSRLVLDTGAGNVVVTGRPDSVQIRVEHIDCQTCVTLYKLP